MHALNNSQQPRDVIPSIKYIDGINVYFLLIITVLQTLMHTCINRPASQARKLVLETIIKVALDFGQKLLVTKRPERPILGIVAFEFKHTCII